MDIWSRYVHSLHSVFFTSSPWLLLLLLLLKCASVLVSPSSVSIHNVEDGICERFCLLLLFDWWNMRRRTKSRQKSVVIVLPVPVVPHNVRIIGSVSIFYIYIYYFYELIIDQVPSTLLHGGNGL